MNNRGMVTMMLALLAVLLVSCSPQAAIPTTQEIVIPTVSRVPGPTSTPYYVTCSYVNATLEPDATQVSLFSPVTESDWVKGDEKAPVTFLVYIDLQCPYCALLEPVLNRLQARYPEDIRIIYRHYPMFNEHDKALVAAQAVEAVGLQSEEGFFLLKDRLFSKYAEWTPMAEAEFRSWLSEEVSQMGLDAERFEKDLDSSQVTQKIADAIVEGFEIGIPGTPFLLINGEIYQGPRDFGNLEAVSRLLMLESKQFGKCPPMVIDPQKQYQATLHTTKGDIVILLYTDKTPVAVNNFVFLAQEGWYDNLEFFRVIPGYIAQSGDPSGTGLGGPGFAFDNEFYPGLNFDQAGVVAFYNNGLPNSNGSQFFITYAPLTDLNGKFTIFGQVVRGMENADILIPRDPATEGVLNSPDRILSISIEEK